MLHIGAGHSNNCQIILKLFGYDREARRRMMLHIGAGHSNNCQIILELFGCDIFCNNLQQKISRKFRGMRDINHLCYK